MNHTGAIKIIGRKGDIIHAAPSRHTTLRQAAESMSRRNIDQAIVELMNEALSRLTVLAYERDDSGALCNIDAATGRILIPLPWGKVGHTRWGLSQLESKVMRRILFNRQSNGVALYQYERSRRAWFVNLQEYPVGVRLDEWQVGVSEYRAARMSLSG